MSTTEISAVTDAKREAEVRRLSRYLLAAFVLPSAGAVLVAAGSEGSPWQDGVLWILYLGGAAGLAAVVGLVFGIPRARADYAAEASERYSSNSNLEQISDWLTRLLVGAGLVELTNIPGMVEGASSFLSEDMTVANAQAFAAAALAYGTGLGFAGGYLWTRLRFRVLLEWSDHSATAESRILAALQRSQKVGAEESDRVLRKVAASAVAVTRDDGSDRRVLWVDDWPGNNASLVDAMRSLQIQVDLALTTREALSRLEQQEYDLIISDMARQEDGSSHPEAGLELIRAVRQSGNQTPIFIYAGRDAMRRREELETEGAALVTDKPSVVFSEAVRTVTAPRS